MDPVHDEQQQQQTNRNVTDEAQTAPLRAAKDETSTPALSAPRVTPPPPPSASSAEDEPRVLYQSNDLPDADAVPEIMAKIGIRVDYDEWPPEPEPLPDENEGEHEDEDEGEQENHPSPAAAEQQQQQQPPQPQSAQNPEPEKPKRNCGRTGATTPEGKMKTRLNALRHGSCARTLIIGAESHEKFFELHEAWVADYPHDSRLLQDFILRTAQAEWHRIRIQDQYNAILQGQPAAQIYNLPPDVLQALDLQQRYLTTAERTFQREFSMLERFWNNHCKPKQSEQPKKSEPPKPEPAKPEKPTGTNQENEEKTEYLKPWEENPPAAINPSKMRFINSETGEYYQNGKFYPPPPDWKPVKIYPGYRHPLDPANWRYEGDPKDRFKPKKRNNTEP